MTASKSTVIIPFIDKTDVMQLKVLNLWGGSMENVRIGGCILWFSLVFIIGACSNGGDDASPSTPEKSLRLGGSYYGASYDIGISDFRIKIDGDQTVSSSIFSEGGILRDGNINGINYVATSNSNPDFEIALIPSPSGKYIAATWLDTEGIVKVGMLEKDATVFRAFTQSTYVGTWTGMQFRVDSNLLIPTDSDQGVNAYGNSSLSIVGNG